MGMRKDLSADIRFQAVKLTRSGKSVASVAASFGVSRGTVYKWMDKYRGKRVVTKFENKSKSGRPKVAEKCDWSLIYRIIRRPASKYGFDTDVWNTSRVNQVLRKEFNCNVSRNTVWRRLKGHGLTYQATQKRFDRMRRVEVDNWTKNILPEILEEVKRTRGILYFGDESKISLSPVMGKTWAPKGNSPSVKVNSKRGGISVISAISRSGHLQFSIWQQNISSIQIIKFCKRLINHHPRRKIFLILDNARTHSSKKFKDFVNSTPRLKIFFFTGL